MIPEFPIFKKLELSDKEDIEKFTRNYPPYSDFNFISMWCWNIKDEMQISQLHNNLVVMFTDYITGEPFFSFIGSNNVNETAKTLLHFSIEKNMKPKLSLIPDDAIKDIANHIYKIEEDFDNFDYIYDLNHISEYKGNKFLQKRNKVNVFLKRMINPRIELLNLQNQNIQHQIMELDEYWMRNKIAKDLNFKIKNEVLATKRFFQAHFPESLGVGLYINTILIGYSIFSILPHNKYVVSHFCKANTTFTGIYDYLIQESAKILKKKDYKYLNYEQDLGLPGLRASKKSFVSKYLRKYVISFQE